MEQPSQSDPATPEPGVTLQTLEQKLAKGAWSDDRDGSKLSPEKRKTIEDLLRKGRSLNSISQETASSKNTVANVRDQLIEREPTLFKAYMANTLQRVANKTVATIEKGIDTLAEGEVKPGAITGLSVTAGILLDKLAQLSGETQVQVVEHRLKIDAGTVSSLIKTAESVKTGPIIDAEVVDMGSTSTTSEGA